MDNWKIKENEITDRYYNEIKGEGWVRELVDQYDSADLIVKKDGKYSCLEVKVREGKRYTKDYLMEEGSMIELKKYKQLKKDFNVNSVVVITISNDGYELRGTVDDNTITNCLPVPATTKFGNREIVYEDCCIILNNEIVDKGGI